MGNVDSLYQPRNVHNEKSVKENTPKARKEKSHAKTQRRQTAAKNRKERKKQEPQMNADIRRSE
jgi:hypothetical protein